MDGRAAKKGPQIFVYDGDGKNDGADCRDPALNQQVLFRELRNNIRDGKAQEQADRHQVVVWHESGRLLMEENGKNARDSDGTGRIDHQVKKAAQASKAQFQPEQ
jgi:hypothetical protein